jgi:hypothetical protein
MLEAARASGADLGQMQTSVASYLDQGYRHNQAILDISAERVRYAITMLMIEILVLVVALVITLAS